MEAFSFLMIKIIIGAPIIYWCLYKWVQKYIEFEEKYKNKQKLEQEEFDIKEYWKGDSISYRQYKMLCELGYYTKGLLSKEEWDKSILLLLDLDNSLSHKIDPDILVGCVRDMDAEYINDYFRIIKNKRSLINMLRRAFL
jgi:hypothetical protein